MTASLTIHDVWREDGTVRVEARGSVAYQTGSLAGVRPSPGADAIILWAPDIPLPDPAAVTQLLEGPCHVWHAGLKLGQLGQPGLWGFCHPRAMLSRDVDPATESMSWRVSLRAVIARNEVFEELGGIDEHFETPETAGLDAGMRWLRHGALLRHVPDLIGGIDTVETIDVRSIHDEVRFVSNHMGRTWVLWALGRGLVTRAVPVRDLPEARRATKPPAHTPTQYGLKAFGPGPDPAARVTVLVPTVGRYPYVEPLLRQLEEQTVSPHQVVVVDQNPADQRHDLHAVAPALPLDVLCLQPPGQCTARNLGLQAATGTHILFLDDDDEIQPDLIEQHLRVLGPEAVMVSGGLVDDAESGPAPSSQQFRQLLQTFPTNNAMIKREVLARTGLFDPTYDRGARADHDLGMRSYLAGHLHVYDPGPRVFHHHAPMGGLRTHGARVRTRGNSRSTLTQRHLRTPTDTYLGLRYYTPKQVHEDLVLSVFATLRGGGGSRWRKAGRLLLQTMLLPDTWRKTKASASDGERLLTNRPEIPVLNPPSP